MRRKSWATWISSGTFEPNTGIYGHWKILFVCVGHSVGIYVWRNLLRTVLVSFILTEWPKTYIFNLFLYIISRLDLSVQLCLINNLTNHNVACSVRLSVVPIGCPFDKSQRSFDLSNYWLLRLALVWQITTFVWSVRSSTIRWWTWFQLYIALG